ncbi:protein FEZ-like [Corylus avellana]|uniref:protein FEZ-like n=1 Tax=Corylus avellana TaxID=13451 RepID=UPI00286A3161|nr:protein FEZ-like [Corylus avellana]
MRFQMLVGFRFHPTVEEIFMFLRMKVNGETLPHDEVGEFDIYGNREPWIIFDPTVKKQFFVFTKLKKKSKSRRDRVVGCGTWKIEHTQEIRDLKNNKLIGIKKSCLQIYKEQGQRNKDLDKMKYPIRNFQHHAQPSNNQQVAVVEPNEIHQNNGEIKRNLSPGEENIVAQQTYPIAAVPVSSSSVEFYATTSPPLLTVFEDDEFRAIYDEISAICDDQQPPTYTCDGASS